MMARPEADQARPIDDPAPVRDFPKYGRPLAYVRGIYGTAVVWTRTYGLIEWLDASGKYHMGWRTLQTSSEWRRKSGRALAGFSIPPVHDEHVELPHQPEDRGED